MVGLARPMVQSLCDRIQFALVASDAEMFGQILPNEPIGVLHCRFLPRTGRFGEEDTLSEVLGDVMMVRHLAPLIPRKRATACCGDDCKHRSKSLHHCVRPVSFGETYQVHIAASRLDHPRTLVDKSAGF